MHKVLGDLCLMAGSPKDALNNFKWVRCIFRSYRPHFSYGSMYN